MPLIDLKTDLKSLKYGKDRPGGGDSGQPYIKNNINNPINQIGFDDGLVRGGVVGAATSSVIDTLRIGKFLTDLPKGPLWIVKQVGLQLSNPKLESRSVKTGIGFIDTIASAISKVGIGPTRTYNLGINTIAQIPVNAFGVHFNRHGLLPVQDDTTKYLAVVQNNNLNTGSRNAKLPQSSTNRLLKYAAKLLPASPPQSKSLSVLDQILSIIPGGSLFVKPQQQTIDSYIGGPGSVYGIGKTFIKRYDYTSNGVNKQQPQEKGKVNYPALLGVSKSYFAPITGGIFAGLFPSTNAAAENGMDLSNPTKAPSNIDTATYGRIITGDIPLKVIGNKLTPLSDVRVEKYVSVKSASYQKYQQIINSRKLRERTYILDGNQVNAFGIYGNRSTPLIGNNNILPDSTQSPVYSNGNEVIKINIPWSEVTREKRIGSGRQDEINLTPLFISSENPGNSVFISGEKYKTRDLIKFRIGAIDTDAPANTTWMVFRAYLTGFQDSFNAEWSDIKYIGRGEKFKLYNGFDRIVTFNFKVAALSAKEMEPMYQKLNYLASNMMPDYKDNVMRGPFTKLTIGDYLNAQPGIFTSLQYSVTDDTPWEISIDQPEGGSTMYDLPHIINVTATFIPIGVKDGNLPERKVSTPVILQSNISENSAESNPWLKSKINGSYTNDPLVAKAVDDTKQK
jgi:hypothetical protein